MTANGSLTPQQQTELVELLEKLKPGFYPFPLFVQLARLMSCSIVEFVPLRLRDGGVEALLLPRPDNDVFWAGGMHIPGCVVRPNDDQHAVFDRIITDELGGVAVNEPQFVCAEIRRSKRGTEQAQIFYVEVTGTPTAGQFYSVADLPDNLVENQQRLIKKATEAFLANRER